MAAFAVSTEALRAVADSIGAVTASVRVSDATRAPADTGHAEVTAAVAAFAAHLDGTWGAQQSATDGVEQTLLRTATVYETAGAVPGAPRGATAF